MLNNYLCLFITLAVVVRQYGRGYAEGLACTVFLIVLLPESVALQLGSVLPSFSIHRLVILLTIYHWYKNSEIKKSMAGVPFYRIMVCTTVCYLFSTILSSFFLVSFKRYLYFVVEYLILFVVIQTSAQDSNLSKRIVKALGYGLLTVGVLGIIERYTGFSIGALFPYDGGGYGVSRFSWASDESASITVSYRHRILFGMACSIATLKFMLDAALQQEKDMKWKNMLFAFTCGASLYFSASRGPWLSFLLGCVVHVVCLPYRFLKPAAILAVAVAVVLMARPGVWVTISGLAEATTNEDSVKGSSFKWRQQVFQVALNEIGKSDPAHMLFGYGGGSTIMTDFGKITIGSGESLPLESWDCEAAVLLYERGIVGLVLNLILFVGMFFQSFFYLRNKNAAALPRMAFVCATMTVICFMLSNVAIYVGQLIYIEAIALAIGSRLLQEKNQAVSFTDSEPYLPYSTDAA